MTGVCRQRRLRAGDWRMSRCTLWIGLVALTALGFALRLAAAQGGLWLDEAWSAVMADQVRTPLGVFLSIDHDNNHHLNSLWLQLVGMGAPPWLLRGLSILSGTGAILVAAAIGVRRGAATGLVAALLFAVSPVMVTYGSEARGYAPMMLALLGAVLLVDRWLAAPDRPAPRRELAAVTMLGMFAQLTFLFGLVALIGWIGIALWRRHGLRAALIATLQASWLAIAVAGFAVAVVIGSAGGTLHFGNYDAFTLAKFGDALRTVFAYALGAPWPVFVPMIAALLLLLLGRGTALAPFHTLALLAFPLTVLLFQIGNSGFPRYYLLCAVALLLLASEALGAALAQPGRRRWIGAALLLILVHISLGQDALLVLDQRGDTGRIVRTARALHPGGATIGVEHPRTTAVIDVLARQSDYPLTLQPGACPAPDLLYLDRNGSDPFPARPIHCGSRYRPVAEGRPQGLSGMNWTLYARER